MDRPAASQDHPNLDLLTALDMRSAVAVTIRHQGQLIGTLVASTRGHRRHVTDDVVLLQGLADQAAQAITNAQLFEELHKSRERLRRLTQQVVSAQEEERRRLARELHAEAGQALTSLGLSLKLIQRDLPPGSEPLGARLAEAIALAGTTLDQLRLLAQDLRPPALDTLGLNHTLEGFCRSFAARTGLALHYTAMEIPALPDPATISLYRLVQEALTNIARHAAANQVYVALGCDAEGISVSITDDGRGFDVSAVVGNGTQGTGMGLLGMQERLGLLGGRLEIDSRPGQGTRLAAYIPVARQQ